MPGRILSSAVLFGLVLAVRAAPAAEPGLSVSDAWMRVVLPSRPAAGYFTLSNTSARERTLVGAETPACGALMLHRSVHQGGQDRMEMVSSVPVPAHGTVKFAPGGDHLMCLSPTADVAPGHALAVTLRFADGGTLAAIFAVRGAMAR
jgi:copper(I)-binding protein